MLQLMFDVSTRAAQVTCQLEVRPDESVSMAQKRTHLTKWALTARVMMKMNGMIDSTTAQYARLLHRT